MAHRPQKIEIVDPTVTMRPQDRTEQLAERPETLDGKRIVLYSNEKQNSDHFLRGVATRLKEEFPNADVQNEVVYKPNPGAPGTRWGLIEKTAPIADIVLVAYGDCGACSRYTVFDAIQFERRGVPVVAYCSNAFKDLSRYDTLNDGVPGLPLVYFDHPIADLEPDEVVRERITDNVVGDTVYSLTNPANEVEAEFISRYAPDEFDSRPRFDRCTI